MNSRQPYKWDDVMEDIEPHNSNYEEAFRGLQDWLEENGEPFEEEYQELEIYS